MLHNLRPFGFPLSRMGLGQTSAATQAQITQIAQQYGVDPALALAVAKQESGYNQGAVSSAGAIGVMQLMPATAASLGVNPNDQTGNITGGVKYLSQLLNQFNGNVPNALAAYNAGPGAVQKYGGVPPYAETQNYVSTIMANYTGSSGSYSALPPSDSSMPSDSTTTFPTTSISDALDAIDWSDPTTIGVAVAAGALFLYAIA